MPRMVDRANSQAAEDKDPKAVRPDVVGKRRLDEKIVEDRPDPAATANDPLYDPEAKPNEFKGLRKITREQLANAALDSALHPYEQRDINDRVQYERGVDQDRYLRNLKAPTDGGK